MGVVLDIGEPVERPFGADIEPSKNRGLAVLAQPVLGQALGIDMLVVSTADSIFRE